ncbi:hypothetical protein OI18_04865 [Flavihumibacter solisilvae]|uniref:Putative auto-transporter adhesin head GIN domain-containing protein n=2 Tax=Flavihumibacter solisilvae TaxID=1349421 RepID=A0A0C1IMZ8_9BACT|nr:hypothetical protein OI18_04865 [Flavihumibacter solisilvae]
MFIKTATNTYNMRILLTVFAALFCLSLVSCKYGFGKRVKGNGNVVSTTKTPGTFNSVEQKGSFDIEIKTAPSNEVLIEAEDNILPHIETYVDGSTLIIRTKEGFNLDPSRDIKIVVSAPSYQRIWSNGSGNITGQSVITNDEALEVGTKGSGNVNLSVNAPEIKAHTYGSGNIELTGETRQVLLESAGSGDLRAADLKSETASIDIKGSGNASAFASKELNVDVKGSGDVSYKGNPVIRSDIKGSGNIRKID